MKIEVSIRIADGYNNVAESTLTRMVIDNNRVEAEIEDAINDAQVALDSQMRALRKERQAKERAEAERAQAEEERYN